MLTGHYTAMEDTFKIRSYGFVELAQLYLPDILRDSASKRLRAWINGNPNLARTLSNLGYTSKIRLLTPEMVKEITRHLGEP